MEEKEGHVRYLRPEYQAHETVETQAALELEGPESRPLSGDGTPAKLFDWPGDLKARAQAVRAAMTHADAPLTVDPDGGRDQHAPRARQATMRELLETLAALRPVEETDDGVFAT